jgi:hypothetical protein
MSSSDSRGTVPLRVRTEDAESEIFLIDGRYQLTARGLGSLEGRYAPGLYKVKVQTGSRIRERYVQLAPGHEELVGKQEGATLEHEGDGVVLRFPRLHFATAVPLVETSWSREEHTEAAVTHSRQVHVRRGRGSQVFVFMRTWTPASGRRPEAPASFRLALHAVDGTWRVDLVTEGARDDDLEDPWAACTVEVDPGVYLLRLGTEAGLELDEVVVASPGWQTQVFLCERQGGAGGSVTGTGSLHTSVHLRRPEHGFDPMSAGLRLTELTRIGLRNRRAVITPELLGALKDTESRNPMLGLYGAHLLLMAEQPDLELVRKVVGHLRHLLGRHPDVEALALALGEAPATPDLFGVPPTLLRSWALVVRATAEHPDLVPRGSLAAAIGDRLWGEGPMVIWKALPPRTRPRHTGTVPDIEALAARLQAVSEERLLRLRDATALERTLIAHLHGARPGSNTGPGTGRPAQVLRAPPQPTMQRMVRALGVPAATLETALLHLLGRLEAVESGESPPEGAASSEGRRPGLSHLRGGPAVLLGLLGLGLLGLALHLGGARRRRFSALGGATSG